MRVFPTPLRIPLTSLVLGLILAVAKCVPAFAQQQYVNRYDLLTAYSHLSSPSVSLQQNGFNTSFGVNLIRWLAVGADFSVFKGDGSIELAKTNVASLLAPFLGGLNPSIPFSATTHLDAKRRALDALSGAQTGTDGRAEPEGYVTNNVTNPTFAPTAQTQVVEEYGRPVRARTADLYRVKVAL